MSKEYGIDPEILSTYESFFTVIPNFGSKHFRFIRRYPKKWSSMVKKAVDNVPVKAKKRIIEKLIYIDKELVDCLTTHNGSPTFDGNLSWFNNAINFHSALPFDGIISNSSSTINCVCDYASFNIDTNPIFDTSSSYRIRRTETDMAEAVKQFLRQAREIHFVDPHFEKLHPRHLRPLKKFLTTIFSRINNVPVSCIYYHTGDSNLDASRIQSAINREILPLLPIGAHIDFVRWSVTNMHNRFILTDIGGVQFGIGLDDDDLGRNGNLYDDIVPLSFEICKEKECGGIKFMNSTHTIFYSITGV